MEVVLILQYEKVPIISYGDTIAIHAGCCDGTLKIVSIMVLQETQEMPLQPETRDTHYWRDKKKGIVKQEAQMQLQGMHCEVFRFELHHV